MLRTEIHKCFLCGSALNPNDVIWKKEPSNKYVRLTNIEGIEIHTINVICECGLTQLLEPLTCKSLMEFYKPNESGKSVYRTLFPYSKELSYQHLLNTLRFIQMCMGRDHIMQDSTNYLEVGGSTMDSWDTIKNVFPRITEVYGYDPALSNLNNPYILNNLFFRKFDIITVINTLEHMYNPYEFLIGLRDNLNANGRVIINVPDLLNTFLNLNMDAWFSAAHLYHFEANSLLHLIQACGYSPVFFMSTTENMGMKLYMCIKKENEIPKRPLPVGKDYTDKRIEFIASTGKLLELKESMVSNGKIK
jgi:hypothetical protein